MVVGLVIFLMLWSLCFVTDLSRIKSNKSPIFCVQTALYKDGGSAEFVCLGYKVNRYVNLTAPQFHERYEIGSWLMGFDPN